MLEIVEDSGDFAALHIGAMIVLDVQGRALFEDDF